MTLAGNAFKLVRVQIAIGSTAALGSLKTATVTAVWSGDSVRKDVVKAITKVVRS